MNSSVEGLRRSLCSFARVLNICYRVVLGWRVGFRASIEHRGRLYASLRFPSNIAVEYFVFCLRPCSSLGADPCRIHRRIGCWFSQLLAAMFAQLHLLLATACWAVARGHACPVSHAGLVLSVSSVFVEASGRPGCGPHTSNRYPFRRRYCALLFAEMCGAHQIQDPMMQRCKPCCGKRRRRCALMLCLLF